MLLLLFGLEILEAALAVLVFFLFASNCHCIVTLFCPVVEIVFATYFA